MENVTPSDAQALPAHKYPLWVVAFILIVCAVTVYSFALLPRYVPAAVEITSAGDDVQNKNYDEAIRKFIDVLDKVPTSRLVRINFAEAIFLNHEALNYEFALGLLRGMRLNKVEWARLKQAMPEEFHQYFTVEK